MQKELRRLSGVMLVMFLALFGALSWIQVVQAPDLNTNALNKRALYAAYEVQRGSIIAGDEEIASSVASDDVYSWQRTYVDPEMWAPITGYINPVLGSSRGLEQAMNPALSGTDDTQFFARLEQIVTGQSPRGSNVLISVDPEAQRAAYEALGDYQGAAIAIEPDTGRILALVTSPSYDTNLLASHDSEAVNQIYSELEADPGVPLWDRAIEGNLNPPGSTFKLVVASAALSSGEYTADSEFDNPDSFTLPGSSSVVRNHDGGTCGSGDKTTLATALRLSCNIPMAELAIELGDEAIREEAKKFGFDSSFSIPMISEAAQYPSAALDDAQTGLTGFGQGDTIAHPLQMAMVAAGIANDGVVMNPRIVDSVVAPDLTVQQEFDNSEFSTAITPEVAEAMTEMMVANVSDGAASGARIEGVDVAGKTGTAEHAPEDPYTLWFTGFAPADDPQVAVAVMIEDGGGLGQSGTSNGIAAPIAKRIIEAVLSE